MQNKPIDKKLILESLNKLKGEVADKNNALLEDFGRAGNHLGTGIYKNTSVVDPDEFNDDGEEQKHEEIPAKEDQQPEAASPVPTQAKPAERPLPDNIVFDGDFTDPEKRAMLSMSDKNWTPMFKRELLASKEDMLEGFDNNPDFVVRAIDENEKVVFVPYKYFDKLFLRNKEVTLNIKDTPIKFMLMIPKNYDDHSMAAAYGDDHALVKRVDGEKTVISKMDLSDFNSIFTKDKKQNIRGVERNLTFKEPKAKPIPKPKLKMVDEDDIKKKPIPKPKLKMVDEEDVKKAIPKKMAKPKLRMVEEMPEPDSLAGKDIIVNSQDTGRRDNRIRINYFDPATNKFSINFRKMNYKVPLDYIQKSFVRVAN